MNTSRKLFGFAIQSFLIASVGFALVVSGWMVFARTARPSAPDLSKLTIVSHRGEALNGAAADLSTAFRRIGKLVKPSVVSIRVVETISTESLGLGRNHPPIPGLEDGLKQRGSGSGFIISPDGYIVTNEHVVGKADKIRVTFDDGRQVLAKLVGVDAPTDLAVIKADVTGLTPVTLGDPAEMEQGDWVMAIGAPFGLEQTLTVGVISATGRNLPSSRANRFAQYNNYLQTDASINPGNSGGPLVNLRGEVVGVNTMILSESGGSEGIGFAIPSDLVERVCRKLILEGRVRRGWLGVSLPVQPMTEAQAKSLGLPNTEGALVQDTVGPESPAARAGLRSGDFIIKFDGAVIRNERELTAKVAETEVGKTVTVEFIRDGQPQSVQVTIDERPGNETAAKSVAKDEAAKNANLLGLNVAPLPPDLVSKLRQPNGVIIESVVPGSPADEAGLAKGIVIHSLNRRPVMSPEDVARLAQDFRLGETVVVGIEVQVNGRWEFRFVSLTIE
ncbi:MAG: Do family serine endopeptidase [Chloracidobacterium sp.]|uniref:Do family serine endopeptidase n=1 Tax=Chloracidobacterium validum TaxID=2821543 RepID=A0ABX8BAX7_9BACT|nr:Do family serine endopeptidase [Chloracidobacterium validum]QUW04089.1 Do family serine endopeptidase [Chloracidobacterium validum]